MNIDNIYQLNTKELAILEEIQNKYYMLPVLRHINSYISKFDYVEVMNYLYEAIISSKLEVDSMLERRKAKGEIKDISQSRKSIAGQIFSLSVVYLFLKNKEIGNVRPNIYITHKTKNKIF